MAGTTNLHMRYRRLLGSVMCLPSISNTQHMFLKILVHTIQSHFIVVPISILLVHLLRSTNSLLIGLLIVRLALSSLVTRCKLRLLRLTHTSLMVAIIRIIVHTRIL